MDVFWSQELHGNKARSMDSTAAKVFGNVFQGFPYAYGTDSGGCRWIPVSTELLEHHLEGSEMIGIYPMVYDPLKQESGPAGFIQSASTPDARPVYPDMKPELWMCTWGSIDIDEGEEESEIIAKNAIKLFSALGITGWLERSRSKGYHVWVFTEEWTPTTLMRKALQAVMQLAGGDYDAVYPKSDSLDGPPGNYMRLPYGGNRPAGRQIMVNPDTGEAYDIWDFIIEAEAERTPLEDLERAAELYQDPEPDLPPPRDYSKAPLMRVDGSRLRGLPLVMYRDGPHAYYSQHGAGHGRHGFLNRFARAMFESGFERGDVMSWTNDLDSRLGQWYEEGPKFMGRRDGDRQMERLVDNAQKIATKHV